jgi:hypothetical protein
MNLPLIIAVTWIGKEYRFSLRALLPMKTGLKSPSLARKSERKVRHCPVLSFDSRLAAFSMGTGESKDSTASDFYSDLAAAVSEFISRVRSTR